ncbi:MAG: response regulator [Candidatus Aminicenantes bacterium]|nr:response regulator [Candidatus Aminicenantes bacterium]
MNKYKILLVDDDEVVLSDLGQVLEDEGYDLVKAKSVEKAIELLEKDTFDLVITDLVMEGVDGFAVVKKIKDLSPETTTIILTGYKDTDFIIDAFRIGVDNYMLKPAETEDILFKVRR